MKADEGRIDEYTIGTWSKTVAWSKIVLRETLEIAKAPTCETCNKSDKSKRGGWKIQKSTVRWVVTSGWREQSDTEVPNDLFGKEFSHDPKELE